MNHSPRLTDEHDDLDRAFAAYFKKQVPSTWPALHYEPVASPSTLRTPSTQPSTGSMRSRVTLAASVAALVGLGLYISSGHRTPPANSSPVVSEPGLMKDSHADGKELMEKLPKSNPPTAPIP